MSDMNDRHCYRVKLPTNAAARRLLGMRELPDPESAEDGDLIGVRVGHELSAIMCGSFGPPCVHCGGVSEALCDFPLGDEGRTCDRALCLECAPTVDADKNYCHEHDEHGRKMLLFPQPKRVISGPGPAPRKRAKPLPKAPPESHRWRVRQGCGDPASHGAVLTGWMTQLEAVRFANKVGGYVETWDEFVKLWRTLYPLARRR
jgi:hypothetical protein